MPFLILILVIATYAQTSLYDERDGKTYKTVKIGTHIWMAENLNYNAEGGKCYKNELENCAKYGMIYDWEMAMKSCPNGWRLPSRVEWENLVVMAGGYNIAGKKLKARSWSWATSLYDYFKHTDSLGFSALPSGYRHNDNNGGFWWTATTEEKENGRSCAYAYIISSYSNGVHENCYTGDFSVRCVKGSEEEAIAIQKARKAAEEAEIAKNTISFTDARDGKKYSAVKIGKQTWMKENLNLNAEGSVCYGNKPENCEKYGRLYNWETAMKACPAGWRLPSNKDWDKLAKIVCGKDDKCRKLKSKTGWGGNYNGTDEFGFSAQPGGTGYSDSNFYSVGSSGVWWSATNSFDYASTRKASFFDFERHSDRKITINSVRCMQD